MSKIRTLLVDDEPLAIRGLEIRLRAFEDIEVVGRCENGREAIKAIKAEKPSLVFLDIQMPGYDGFQVIEALVGSDLPLFIFVTAFDQFAMKAFETHALDYLLKPVEEERLRKSLVTVRRRLDQQTAIRQNARLVEMVREIGATARLAEIMDGPPITDSSFEKRLNIKDGGRVVCLDIDLVEWIDAAGDYMCIHAAGETHIVRETMKRMVARLDPARFQRVHRSAIVNVDMVREVNAAANGQYVLVLESGGKVRMSRSYKDVMARFL